MKRKILLAVYSALILYIIILVISLLIFPFIVSSIILGIGILAIASVVTALQLNKAVKKTRWFRNTIPDMDNYPTNEWYREHEERNFDVINIGSSSAKFAFDYSNLHIKAFNWAERPQSLSYGFKILKTYFSILKRGGNVIVSLGPFSGLNVDGKWPKTANDKYYYTLPPELVSDYLQVAIRRNYPFFISPLRSIKYLLKDIDRSSRPDNKDIDFDKDALHWIEAWKGEFNIANLDARLSPENEAGKAFRISLLSDLISFCVERGLKPVLVIPPMHHALASRLSPTFRENYIYSFIRKANTADIPFYDYMDDRRFAGDKYFRDAFLMNEEGAGTFTETFLKDAKIL